jgi:hypothetical protein
MSGTVTLQSLRPSYHEQRQTDISPHLNMAFQLTTNNLSISAADIINPSNAFISRLMHSIIQKLEVKIYVV